MNSISAAFEESALSHAKRIVLKGDGGLGRTYTYAELLDEIHAVAGGLSQEKYRDQVEIGLISENRPEWAIAYLAILAAGKTVVPVDANLKPNEINYIIKHAAVEMLFCSGGFEPVLADLSKDLKLFSFDEDSAKSWTQLRQSGTSTADIQPRDTAVLIYTSGTTGAPKAVELTHRNLLSNVEGIISAVPIEQDDVLISVLPLHHTFEATVGFLTPMMRGASIVYARSLNSRDILEDIKRNQATIMCGVPLLYEKMYQSFKRKTKDPISAVSFEDDIPIALWNLVNRLEAGVEMGKVMFRRTSGKSRPWFYPLVRVGRGGYAPEYSTFLQPDWI